jgi:hypothetical protein
MRIFKKKNQKLFTIMLLFAMFVISGLTIVEPGVAQESVSVRVIRRTGVDWGIKINGALTVKGTGSSGIVRMELFFNGTSVANSTTNSLTYDFHTDEYLEGKYLILLQGWDSNGNVYTAETSKTFFYMSGGQEIGLIVGVIVFIIGALGVKYFMQKRNKANLSNPTKKDNVQIGDI